VLTDEDIRIVRPENGIAADDIDAVVGRILRDPLDAEDALSYAKLESPAAE
jgi:sialic acid synthase SpsE